MIEVNKVDDYRFTLEILNLCARIPYYTKVDDQCLNLRTSLKLSDCKG